MNTTELVKAQCFNCNTPTEQKSALQIDDKVVKTYFDLCEKCKLQQNCFTCRYSKAWYFRYKGSCDITFYLFTVSEILERNDQEAHTSFTKILAKHSLKERVYAKMTYTEFFDLLKNKLQEEMDENTPDCCLYKTKRIGLTFRDFWNHSPCKRYYQGEATKNEFDEYNSHW